MVAKILPWLAAAMHGAQQLLTMPASHTRDFGYPDANSLRVIPATEGYGIFFLFSSSHGLAFGVSIISTIESSIESDFSLER